MLGASMRKHLPALWGFFGGCAVGLYMECFVTPEQVPHFIGVLIGAPVGWLGSVFAKNASEAGVLVSGIVCVILWCGVLGAAFGLLLGLLARVAKRRSHGSP